MGSAIPTSSTSGTSRYARACTAPMKPAPATPTRIFLGMDILLFLAYGQNRITVGKCRWQPASMQEDHRIGRRQPALADVINQSGHCLPGINRVEQDGVGARGQTH